MTQIVIQLGSLDDVSTAASIYERSNLARRRGDWPSRSSRVAQVTALLQATAGWFLIGREGDEALGMALVHPFRASGGTGDVIPGALFLSLLYVLPDRWSQGIGGTMLDAVIAEGARRGCHRVHLWTHKQQNERAHRLYQSRNFAQTGRTAHGATGEAIGEWLYDGTAQP